MPTLDQPANGADVLVVVGVRLYPEGIADALRRSGDVLAGLAADEREALELVLERPPAVAVFDVDGRGHETVRRLRRRARRCGSSSSRSGEPRPS